MTVYSTPQWKRRRHQVLRNQPTCALCGKRSQVADHHPITRKQLVAIGEPDPDDLAFLRALCIPCHNSKTATHDRPTMPPR